MPLKCKEMCLYPVTVDDRFKGYRCPVKNASFCRVNHSMSYMRCINRNIILVDEVNYRFYLDALQQAYLKNIIVEYTSVY
jgi:hypothetical protein